MNSMFELATQDEIDKLGQSSSSVTNLSEELEELVLDDVSISTVHKVCTTLYM